MADTERKKQGLTLKGTSATIIRVPEGSGLSGKKYRVLLEADYSKDGDELSLFLKGAMLGIGNDTPGSDTEALHRAICERV